MKKYPKIGRTYRHEKNNCAQCRCGAIGRYKVDIAYTYMRGDDDVVWACEKHKKDIEYLTIIEQDHA